MVTDNQVRRLKKLMQKEGYFSVAAAKAGMDEKTAKKYRKLGKLPSELKQPHEWRTCKDPFDDDWIDIKIKLELNPGILGTGQYSGILRTQYLMYSGDTSILGTQYLIVDKIALR